MLFGDDPSLEGKSGCKGLKGDKLFSICDNSFSIAELLLDQIAIDTTSVIVIISGCLL
jgi:hypothetical protein